jgi:UDPglucose 6-dehydrogenase
MALWGLSFKPQTDDMREAPALRIIEELLHAGVKIRAYDPVALEEARRRLGENIEFCGDKYEALIDADGLIVVTEWPEFRVLNYKVLIKLMREKVIFDGRNIYEPEELLEYGFTYYSIGRRPVKPLK